MRTVRLLTALGAAAALALIGCGSEPGDNVRAAGTGDGSGLASPPIDLGLNPLLVGSDTTMIAASSGAGVALTKMARFDEAEASWDTLPNPPRLAEPKILTDGESVFVVGLADCEEVRCLTATPTAAVLGPDDESWSEVEFMDGPVEAEDFSAEGIAAEAGQAIFTVAGGRELTLGEDGDFSLAEDAPIPFRWKTCETPDGIAALTVAESVAPGESLAAPSPAKTEVFRHGRGSDRGWRSARSARPPVAQGGSGPSIAACTSEGVALAEVRSRRVFLWNAATDEWRTIQNVGGEPPSSPYGARSGVDRNGNPVIMTSGGLYRLELASDTATWHGVPFGDVAETGVMTRDFAVIGTRVVLLEQPADGSEDPTIRYAEV